MALEKLTFNIQPLSNDLNEALKFEINHKTKPLGSLGQLERIAYQLGRIQQSVQLRLSKPTVVLVGADHGICAQGVSPCPQELTWQQMKNFAKKGGGIGLFANLYKLDMLTIDAGVDYHFSKEDKVEDYKIRNGSRDFSIEPAMTTVECRQAMENGAAIVSKLYNKGCNVIAFGEMGIGNTSPASVLMSQLCNIPLDACVGAGSGLDATGIQHKLKVLNAAISKHGTFEDPFHTLACYGGLEIATICGGILKAAELKMLYINDGFIITSALLVAHAMYPEVLDYTIFSHQSNEGGHKHMISYMKGEPILNLDLRLGEGTGAAMAYPIIQGAVEMMNKMTTFTQANVTDTTKKGITVL
ncbi:MAG: nicotinate-nucleotide--dimethylbenzimidazole phosphoribosyltransferase [Flavobacteriaceae bacterium]|nr:MAG: nicotinate-nucleotide--dimethylbenzimidazole phosphoribosyltransferase [Flavobacteriaceae bacterium]